MANEEKTTQYLLRQEVAKRLNPHLLSIVQLEKEHPFAYQPARELVTWNRLDLLAKYIFARSIITNRAKRWGEYVYHEHLRATNPTFIEGDRTGKLGYQSYRDRFIALIRSLAESGFDPDRSVIPVTRRGTLVDGAHRVAAALALNLSVPTVALHHHDHDYSAKKYEHCRLHRSILDVLALEYCRIKSLVFIAVLFPPLRPSYDACLRTLEQYAHIVYRKALWLSPNGYRNLLHLIYHAEPWLGHNAAGTDEMTNHLRARYSSSDPIDLVLLDPHEDDQGSARTAMLMAKTKIRQFCNQGNLPLHINDSHAEALWLATHALGPNAAHYLNFARRIDGFEFNSLQRWFRRWLWERGKNTEDYSIDTGGTLAVYGLRDTHDLDFLSLEPAEPNLPNINNHASELLYHDYPLDDLIYDPRLVFYHHGLKFVSPKAVIAMKQNRAQNKDLADIALLESIERGRVEPDPPIALAKATRGLRQMATLTLKKAGRTLIPSYYHAKISHTLRRGLHLANVVLDQLGPKKRTMIYYGFELHYPAGTSLIRDLEPNRIYEPDVTRAMRQLLAGRPHPRLLDIGGNIGLITLNMIYAFHDLTVDLFEPRAEIVRYLRDTLKSNMLESTVTVHEVALGREPDERDFYTHRIRDASGDGFVDTRRAGRTRPRKVRVESLDRWWYRAGRPSVDVIKIDVEGAELWVLEGGSEMLQACTPALVLELQSVNLEHYPHGADDVLQFLNTHSYAVFTLSGEPPRGPENMREESLGHLVAIHHSDSRLNDWSAR